MVLTKRNFIYLSQAPGPPRHPAENLQPAVPAPQAPTRHPAG